MWIPDLEVPLYETAWLTNPTIEIASSTELQFFLKQINADPLEDWVAGEGCNIIIIFVRWNVCFKYKFARPIMHSVSWQISILSTTVRIPED